MHNALIEGQEKLAIYVKAVINMSMEQSHTASAYDLSRTTNVLNANMNQIGKLLSAISKQPYQPIELPLPDSGPSQEVARILSDTAFNIEHIPLPIPNPDGKSESQSSFGPNAPVIAVGTSKDSLLNMENGNARIYFKPEVEEDGSVEAMNVDKAERENRKSKEF